MRTNEPRMPTDEQRKRFEEWEQTEAAAFLDDPDHRNYSLAEAVWLHAWLARDAEVQALKHALTELADCAEDATKRLPYPRGSLDFAIFQARTALAGGETGETE